MRRSKEVFSNLVTLREKLERDQQEDDFTELLAVQHEALTELEAQRKEEQEEENWYTKAAAAVQNAIQRYRVIYDEKKRATTQTSLDHFFKRVDRIESSKEPEPVPSTSGVSESAACPLSPIADDLILQLYHLPPPLPPPVSNSSCLFTRCQPLYASCCTVLLYFSRSWTRSPSESFPTVKLQDRHTWLEVPQSPAGSMEWEGAVRTAGGFLSNHSPPQTPRTLGVSVF
ncbi:hypothetical protein J1605_015226 [Eschrichtius robustus]|uniref:Uncharacterized protein n=1 Tax=Eschrichtius robustus TaxID=9764 RepID=A0AB34GBC5_ESCRO|nr:hypothetical protein J1605_015226 [Eschrichtius robustus]